MNSLKRFLIGLFSSSAVVGFVIINYYCFEVINYIPEGVSFGTSLANLAIALRIFIPLAVSVCFASYIFFLDDIRKSPGSDIKAYHIALVFIIGFVFIIFINDFLNARYFEKSFYKLFIAQGSVFILISALIWLLFVHLPDSVLGQNVLNASSYRTVGGINNHRSVIIIIFTLIISVVFYFWSYSLLGWRSINNFVINNMEVAGFRKSNVDLFLKKSGEEIVILSCAGCDKKLSGLSKVNKNKSDAEFTAILSHADILWSTGDKHYIGFCNKGEHVYAELPKDSYNVSYAHSQTRVAESMPCLKTEGEGGHPAPPLTAPPADAPKPVVDIPKPVTDTPVVDKQPTIVINNYNVPVQAISGLIHQQRKPKPPASTPPKRSVHQCNDVSPHP